MAKIGAGFDLGTGWPVMKDLRRLGVKQYPVTIVKEVGGGAVTLCVGNKEGSEQNELTVPCDMLVISVGAMPGRWAR